MEPATRPLSCAVHTPAQAFSNSHCLGSFPSGSTKLLTKQQAAFSLTVEAPPLSQFVCGMWGRGRSHGGEILVLVVTTSQVFCLVFPGGSLPPVPTSCPPLAGDAHADVSGIRADLLGS